MTLRWGLIGCGDIVEKRVGPALRDSDRCDLVAVARARSDLVESCARQFGARKPHRDWRALVADPEIDAVYIATPVARHAEQTVAAAEAGKHVLCEKPMSMNLADDDRMIEACRRHDVKLGLAYYRRFYPVVAYLKAQIASEAIGRPVLVQLNAFERFNPMPDDPRYWFLVRSEAGGGPMADFGCHRIEVLINLLGAVKTVRGLAGRAAFEREVEDTATACFEFHSGAQATVCVTHAAAQARDSLEIYGTEGSISVPVLNRGEFTIRSAMGQRRVNAPHHSNVHLPLIEDFVDAVERDRDPAVGGEVGREVDRLLSLIYQSAR